jgi:hypothetical protein
MKRTNQRTFLNPGIARAHPRGFNLVDARDGTPVDPAASCEVGDRMKIGSETRGRKDPHARSRLATTRSSFSTTHLSSAVDSVSKKPKEEETSRRPWKRSETGLAACE